jgi:hypothetical protein
LDGILHFGERLLPSKHNLRTSNLNLISLLVILLNIYFCQIEEKNQTSKHRENNNNLNLLHFLMFFLYRKSLIFFRWFCNIHHKNINKINKIVTNILLKSVELLKADTPCFVRVKPVQQYLALSLSKIFFHLNNKKYTYWLRMAFSPGLQ